MRKPRHSSSKNKNVVPCTIACNSNGAFCTPDSCREDTPVQAIYRGEQYENLTLDFIKSLKLTGDIIHAGAYFGDSLPCLGDSILPKNKIWAFEPNPESFRCAQITILLNRLDEKIELFNHGLGDTDEVVNLQINSSDNQKKLGGTTRIVSNQNIGTTEISIKKLDDVIPHNRQVSLIHLDVEGYEEKVLKGASDLIEKYKPLVILEVSKNIEDTLAMMNKLGYEMIQSLEMRDWGQGIRNAVFKAIG